MKELIRVMEFVKLLYDDVEKEYIISEVGSDRILVTAESKKEANYLLRKENEFYRCLDKEKRFAKDLTDMLEKCGIDKKKAKDMARELSFGMTYWPYDEMKDTAIKSHITKYIGKQIDMWVKYYKMFKNE